MKRIRLSVLDLVPVLEHANPQYALMQAVRLAQTAEKLGYSRYWVAEHHDMPNIVSSCPEVLLSHVGAKTERIRIGSGAVLLPYYKPYKVAETFHMLATLYPDRIDLGIGRAPGGHAHASMALSDNYLEQVRRLPESIQSLVSLLSDDFRIEEQRVSARPVPAAAPELWMLGTNSKSAQFASRFGTGYVFGHFMSDQDGKPIIDSYRESYQATSIGPEPRVIVAVSVVCAETDSEAARCAELGARAFLGEAPIDDGVRRQYRGRAVVGSPDSVRRQLLEMQEQFGADEFIVVTTSQDYETRIRSYELLAKSLFL
ncbi:LLM class flavin-dependent oxidoreductase [Paenibacillus mesophilus]|uniref:LLM class flavin-dependent oxidoreductase n=1 Tax=Paenibacillus mesophilus TaxID=2582849 RepID=UPI00110EF69E|nr:LLM class flavin-dependent oxidoreductase [Paenibacillus mesophilus]TMV52190.1 LLM class flavin-dependent oxidoreductase [Paenibacillus mesophilus]